MMSPHSDPRPADSARQAGAVLLLQGGFLVYAGMALLRLEPSPTPPLPTLLALYGAAAFLLGLNALTQSRFPSVIARALARAASWLDTREDRALLLLQAPLLSLIAWLAAGDGLLMPSPWLAVSAWGLALASLLLGGLEFRRVLPVRMERKEALILGAILLFALLTRIWQLGQIPWVLAGDEASMGLSAVELIEGTWNNVFGVSWFSFPALYFTLPALSIRAFGQTVFGLRLPSVVAGVLTVGATYLYARNTFGRRAAILGAGYLAAFHFHIHFSRIGLNNIWDGIFFATVGAALWRAWTTDRRAAYLIAGVALGLGLYFYTSTRALVVMSGIWWLIAALRQPAEVRKRIRNLSLMVFAGVVVVLPLGLFYLSHPDHFAAPLRRVAVLGPWLENEIVITGLPAWRILLDQFKTSALAFTSVDLRHWYAIDHPMLFPLAASLFFLGLLRSLTRLLDPRYLWLLLWLTAAIAAGALSESTPAAQRYVLVAPCIALLVALPLDEAAERLLSPWPERRRVVHAGLAVLLAALIWTDLSFYFGDYTPSRRFSDRNTEVAQRLAESLQGSEAGQRVYFVGAPRMGFYSISTLPYLAPDVEGLDLDEDQLVELEESPPETAIFVFLPEHLETLEQIRERFPRGHLREVFGKDAELLFITYELRNF